MHTFLDIALSFPTVVFSVALLVASGYWLLTLLGLMDLNILDLGDGGDIGGGELGGFSGALLKFGLDGLPLALIFTAVSLIGWLLTYFGDDLVLRLLGGDLFRIVAGAGLIIAAFVIALPLAGLVLHPFKPLFTDQAGPDAASFLGREATVRSPQVNAERGEVDLDDGGAGLILKVRAGPDDHFVRGDRVVLVEYLPDTNAYRVIHT